jgi:uncharacterized protein YbaR (Trm112 family)
MAVMIDPWLLEKLVCPVSRGPLLWDAERSELISEAAGLAYPVRHGTPVLLARAARVLTPTDGSDTAPDTSS